MWHQAFVESDRLAGDQKLMSKDSQKQTNRHCCASTKYGIYNAFYHL